MQFMIKPRRFLSCSDACLPRGSKTYPFWNLLCLYSTVGYERIKLLEFLLFMYIPMRKTEERVEERLVKKFSTAPLCSLPPPHESNTVVVHHALVLTNNLKPRMRRIGCMAALITPTPSCFLHAVD